MNVNRLYLARVFICVGIEIVSESFEYIDGMPYFKKRSAGNFLKEAVVYHKGNNQYVDFTSGEEYKFGLDSVYSIGDMYIREGDLKPIREVDEVTFNRNNMSKRKIRSLIHGSGLLNKKEDDK